MFWCGNISERHSFRTVSGDRPKNLVKKVFLEISQNLQKNQYFGVWFCTWGLQLYYKQASTQVFFYEFCEIAIFKNTPFVVHFRCLLS